MRLSRYFGPLLGNPALIASALLAAQLQVMAQAAMRTDPSQPARIVESYALTSSLDLNGDDPKDWRLLGSNDRGTTWATLDVRTNQQFKYRSQRLTFHIRDPAPFNIYRLQVDAASLPEFHPDIGVHLAGLFLKGPMVGIPGPSNVEQIVSCSRPHPLFGRPVNAFDDDPAIKWVDYGLNRPGGCWLQVQYAFNSETLITNVSEATRLARLPATQQLPEETGLRILSNLTAQVSVARKLTGYALTSANDVPGRDPRDWELLGSDDDGKSWSVIDSRVNQVFTERFEHRVFNLKQAATCRLYRLRIDACFVPGSTCQLAELEPIYADPQNSPLYSLVVDSIMDNPPLEGIEKAFDGNVQSKWLCNRSIFKDQPAWIQWQLAPKEGLPVISRRKINRVVEQEAIARLLSQTNGLAMTVKAYALTSANDAPERDPCDWRLLGSDDGGNTWRTLDVRQGEIFGSRSQRRVFNLKVPTESRMFRLQIDSTSAPQIANSVQLAEVQLLFDKLPNDPPLTVLASAQDENSPFESVKNLFNGDHKTKWLDFADSSVKRASWVEWRYVNGNGHGPVDLNRVQMDPYQTPNRLTFRLNTLVLATSKNSAQVLLADSSGLEQFHLNPWPRSLTAGTRVQIEGDLQVFGRGTFSFARTVGLDPATAIVPGGRIKPPSHPLSNLLAGRFQWKNHKRFCRSKRLRRHPFVA